VNLQFFTGRLGPEVGGRFVEACDKQNALGLDIISSKKPFYIFFAPSFAVIFPTHLFNQRPQVEDDYRELGANMVLEIEGVGVVLLHGC
jgi:hypothetical protein